MMGRSLRSLRPHLKSNSARLVLNRQQQPVIARRQEGVALIVIVILTTLALVLLTGITYRHELDSASTARTLISEQAILLSLSAESWAKSVLVEDGRQNNTDSMEDLWAQVIPVLPVENGLMTGCIVDMHSRFNLNNLRILNEQSFLAVEEDQPGSPLFVYLRLLEGLELDPFPERAAVIVDWIDLNSELVIPSSAEDSEYSLEEPARLAANTPLTSVSELASVSGYSLADVATLDDFVTALPVTTAINVNTAEPLALMALSPLIDESVVAGLIELRPFTDVETFYAGIEEQLVVEQLEEIRRQIPAQLISVQSEYFELRAQISLAGEEIALVSLLQRSGRGGIKTLSRSFSYIPSLQFEEGDINPIQPLCNTNGDSPTEDEVEDLLG